MKRIRSASNGAADESTVRKRIHRAAITKVAAEMVVLREQVRALQQELATIREKTEQGTRQVVGFLGEFPDELLVELFQWFTQVELLTRLARVCCKWHTLINTRLTVLDCESFTLSGRPRLQGFRKYTRIEELSLAHNFDAAGILANIPTAHLHRLNLTGTTVAMDQHLRFDNLQRLVIGSSNIRGNMLVHIPESITHLTLSWCQNISTNDVTNLRHLTRLEHLSLSHLGNGPHLGDDFLPLELAPTLRSLTLSELLRINDHHLKSLHHFRALESLSLVRMDSNLSFFEWWADQGNITPLEHLTCLSVDFFVRFVCFTGTARMVPNLRHLTVGNVSLWDTAEIASMPNLETLDFRCDAVSSPGLLGFIGQCSKLRHLRLNHGISVDIKTLNLPELLKNTNLETLQLVDFPHMTAKEFDDLRNEMPHLKSITYARYPDGS